VTPDILCLGKGLTGGYLPMAATVARRHVYDAFLGPAASLRQFFHGHTFGGNPLAAAAALASIELLMNENTVSQVSAKGHFLRERLSPLASHPHVGNIRGRGLMIGIEIVQDRAARTALDPSQLWGRRICHEALEHGVWIRPLGDVIVLMPPLVADWKELEFLADVVVQSIERAWSEGDSGRRVPNGRGAATDHAPSLVHGE
jgi:adenosylmethionine-8-amino-7-oxononanoate aminotransferase